MKKILQLSFTVFLFSLFSAQSLRHVAREVKDYHSKRVSFKKVSLFSVDEANSGSIPKLGGYAKSLDNLNKKNALSRTPLSCNLKFFILALNDSAEALVLLLSK